MQQRHGVIVIAYRISHPPPARLARLRGPPVRSFCTVQCWNLLCVLYYTYSAVQYCVVDFQGPICLCFTLTAHTVYNLTPPSSQSKLRTSYTCEPPIQRDEGQDPLVERGGGVALGYARRRGVRYLPRPIRRNMSQVQIPR